MPFELPPLPYAPDALEPYISEKTIDFHYGKHHQAYVTKVNDLVKGTQFEDATLEDIIRDATGGIFNNGAQVWNHTFYWNCLNPDGGKEPSGDLMEAIVRDFGSFEDFKQNFSAAGATLFGSGWAWLVENDSGRLEIIQESNAGNPLRNGYKPLLTCDVWEHAYYIDKKNKRPDYIADFWKLVDWKAVENRY